jgi:adenosylcobinamide-phosphate synthase
MTRVGPLPAIALGAGWVADALLGDPARYHPVAGFGRSAQTLERMLWRPSRAAGAAYMAALVVPPTAAAAAVDAALRRRPLARFALALVATWVVLGGRSLAREARRLADAVARGDLDRAREILPALVGRDPSELDGLELCRAAVESVAENTADAVVGPLLWCAVTGPAGAVAYRAANTLDAMVGHRNERYERFGWSAARLDDALTWPAARLASLLTVALAPLAGADAHGAWRILRRDGFRHPSPNAGRLEAAFAGALGVRLGGSNRYGDRVEDRSVLGDGPRPDVDAVRRAVRLSQLVGASAAALCVVLAWSLGR